MNKTLKKIILTPLNILYRINSELTLKFLFKLKQGHKLNLKNPQTFNEKINWLKLYYRNDLMPICADKYTVRQYVKDCGHEDILNELLWEGYDANEIPFDSLPQKFVAKVTHGSGQNIICENKNELDGEKTITRLNKWLKEKYIPCYGEWFYGVIKPRIIIEKFLEDHNRGIPVDYKMFYFNNFNGKNDIAFTAIDTDRFIAHKRKVYDRNWKLIPEIYLNWPDDPNVKFKRPTQYEKMVEIAKNLAKPFPHARVDFYVINEKIYFGEITFTDNAGFAQIKPYDLHKKMGSWLKLSIGKVKNG